jgi:SMC interacting uncharacterized protein involved in chromosome segregation
MTGKHLTQPLSTAHIPQHNSRGQSSIEFLVALLGLIVLFGSFSPVLGNDPTEKHSVYEVFSDTIQNKYKSYCFGVAISDPPREEFDEKVDKDAKIIKEFIAKIKDILDSAEDLIE